MKAKLKALLDFDSQRRADPGVSITTHPTAWRVGPHIHAHTLLVTRMQRLVLSGRGLWGLKRKMNIDRERENKKIRTDKR